ncbi:hypothetical protein AB0395_26625 [Streptosporangium sp. NPDC051023]|uniref:hypothetical protein n=1 Tax=Streptosporangium sp. NPDC051023 TaxID=3155410 RepID=UPI00344CADA6
MIVSGLRSHATLSGPVSPVVGYPWDRVRDATDMLRRVADDPSGGGGHRPGAKLLLTRLDEGWSEAVG